MTAPDGHIYTIPYVCTDTTVGYSPYINTKWLENVGMSTPTTTDEFEAVLKAFKEQDANGNGDASDEIRSLPTRTTNISRLWPVTSDFR